MLGSLHIKNLATIEDLEIHLQEGFSILTGETGAGKSIIIDGIRLALGEKASPDLVRTGKAEATVEAVFHLGRQKGNSTDLPLGEEGEVLIQRHITPEGSGKAYLNGVLVPAKKLKEVSPFLVDIYGQNDHIFLLQLENHLRYLDDFLGLDSLREEVSRLAQKLRLMSRQKEELERRKREREQRLDFLGFQIKEIEAAGLRPGEWEELLAERNILKNSEKIALLVEAGLGQAYSEEGSVSPGLSRLQEIVHELARYDASFEVFNDSLAQSAIAVRELADSMIRFKERQNLGPERLEELEARLSTIEKLRRKYGGTTEGILGHLAKAKQESADLARSEETLAGLETDLSGALGEYKARAGKLSRLRRDGAPELQSQMEKEMALLGLRRARFKVMLETAPAEALAPAAARETGLDEVEFLISPNPGEELRPLRKVASGGELSRIMLALKTIGKEKDRLKTLIFDEIDSGIGGKTAECIASKLRDLARHHQVICITHLPQIASFAPHHFRIEKTVAQDRTFTRIKELDFEERVAEISRLLSGSRMTSTSLQNAREMLHLNLEKQMTGRRKT
jgi:DNA repair protein RecN (Recombination protein N)